MNVLLVSFATAFVAVVALVVAAMGITNTMIMSVLERTHEIGIMKALGARDGHIRLIFLVEGVLMGLLGSGIGLLWAGWRRSRATRSPGASWSRRPRRPSRSSLFVFPIWLVVGRAGPGLPDHHAGGAVSGLAGRAGRPGDLAAARVGTPREGEPASNRSGHCGSSAAIEDLGPADLFRLQLDDARLASCKAYTWISGLIGISAARSRNSRTSAR